IIYNLFLPFAMLCCCAQAEEKRERETMYVVGLLIFFFSLRYFVSLASNIPTHKLASLDMQRNDT
ncbi:MAG: hypothetical protein ACI90V_006920, partial [Bacillariaceae sp.]